MPPPAASAIVATMLSNCTLPRRQPHVERRGVGAGNAAIDYRWPDQHIDYYFDERTWLEPSKKRAARRTVEIAVDELKHKVAQYGGIALTFTELASPGTHALNITAEDACSATVGYNAGPNLNIMNIGQCYTNEAFVKHELGHAVGGLWHEQQHPFASRYMHKGCDDTNDCDENCDQKGPFVATTTPYDPTSIMHYGLGACGGMVLNSVGLALAQALNIHPMAVGAAVNYSIHDAHEATAAHNALACSVSKHRLAHQFSHAPGPFSNAVIVVVISGVIHPSLVSAERIPHACWNVLSKRFVVRFDHVFPL